MVCLNCFHGVTIRNYYYFFSMARIVIIDTSLVAPKLLKTLDKWSVIVVFMCAFRRPDFHVRFTLTA